MKLLQQAKRSCLLILQVIVSYSCLSQTKMVVNGVKVNMANAVFLSAKDLSASNNSLINVSRSTLKLAGITSSAGAIDARYGTAELNGSAVQQLAAGSFSTKTIKALTINNTSGATVNDTLNITDVLTVASGNLISQGFLTLKSNDSGTARVAPVTSVAPVPISGNVIVERFITSKRAFRFLTAPVNTTTTIRDNWMEGVNNPNTTSGNVNPVPNFGTHITGGGGSFNGFDETITNNPSLFTFNNQTQKWVAATSTSFNLKVGQALRMMVRGSRSTNLNSNTPPSSPTTLRAKGTLLTGTVLLTAPGRGGTAGMPELATDTGYSFIANPYASPIDWLTIQTTDISSTIYVFDPTISGINGRGAYVAYNRSIGPNGVSSNDTSKVDNNIQSGQSFFIKATGPNPTFTVLETNKTSLYRRVFRNPNKIPKISLQLLLPDQLINGGAADGLAAYFSDDFNTSIGNEDSYKFTNQDENIAILRNGKTLCIEGRKPVTANDTIPLKMWQLSEKNYVLKLSMQNFSENTDGYLEDEFLHTSTMLSKDTPTTVSFSITSDPLSVAAERFRIVFKTSTLLAQQLSTIKAFVKNKGIEVDWQTSGENETDKFIIEKSANAKDFVTLKEVPAKLNTTFYSHNWFDENPIDGDNYYRIKNIYKSGSVSYSKIAKAYFEAGQGTISVVSNEGNTNSLIVTFKNIKKGKYLLNLINNTGQKVYSGSVDHDGGSSNQTIKLKYLLTSGMYHLQVSGSNRLENLPVFIH